MTFPFALEDFSDLAGPLSPEDMLASLREEGRSEGFEEGYQAGWADAELAAEAAGTARLEALAARLGELQLTWKEARAEVLSALGPLLEDLVSRCLSDTARVMLPGLVREALEPWVTSGIAEGLVLRCHPADRPALQELTVKVEGLVLLPDDSLPEASVSLRGPGAELRINTAAALADVSRSLKEFFTRNEQDRPDG